MASYSWRSMTRVSSSPAGVLQVRIRYPEPPAILAQRGPADEVLAFWCPLVAAARLAAGRISSELDPVRFDHPALDPKLEAPLGFVQEQPAVAGAGCPRRRRDIP